jgi:hypothetical protein
MSVTYREFLDIAKSLIGSGTEIGDRCAASRAYYGLYHCALEYADTVSMPPISACAGPTHKTLRCFFEDDLNPDRGVRLKMRSLGVRLKQLHEFRVSADYYVRDQFGEIDAQSTVHRCEVAVEDVLKLKQSKAA